MLEQCLKIIYIESYSWQWEKHPAKFYAWKFTDLKIPPNKVHIYNDKRMNDFLKLSKEERYNMAIEKEDRGYDGWTAQTLQSIKFLLELSPKKEAEELFSYYTSCGIAVAYEKQLKASSGVTSQNLFIRYERKKVSEQILLNKAQYRGFPSQVDKNTVASMLYV